MKTDRNGQAAVIDNTDYSKLRKQIKSQKYKILLDLAWYTGERWGALVQLRIDDVFNPDGSPRSEITFRACTRKASPDGKRQTRQLPVHETLRESLQGYKPDLSSPWLFPNREGARPITVRWADKILRGALRLGCSWHQHPQYPSVLYYKTAPCWRGCIHNPTNHRSQRRKSPWALRRDWCRSSSRCDLRPLTQTRNNSMTTTNTNDQYLIFKVEDFCQKLKSNKFKHPVDKAKALETLADLAWDDVEDLYQSAVRIDP